MRDLIVATEHQEQATVIQWSTLLLNKCPLLAMLYAIPNAAKRSMALAAMMKAEGMKSGVPDLCLPVARSDFHGLYIEMKRKKGGGVTSKEQSWWKDALTTQGYRAVICKGADEAIAEIKSYMGI